MALLENFDVTGTQGSDQLAQWDAALWGEMGGLQTQTLSETFRGAVHRGRAGDVSFCELFSSPARAERNAAAAARGERGLIKLSFQRRGRSIFSQRGRDVVLDRGGWAFYDIDQSYSVTNLTDVHQIVLMIPKALLGASAGQIRRCAVRDMAAGAGISRMVSSYVDSLLVEQPAIDQIGRAELGEITAHLVRLAIAEKMRDEDLACSQETLRIRISEFVRRNIGNPELTVDVVAARFHCTKRHLHRVFSSNGSTLDRFIWNSRLDRIAVALLDAANVHRSVTEIALTAGFNSSAHFSKAFKDRYASSPRAYRAERAATDH